MEILSKSLTETKAIAANFLDELVKTKKEVSSERRRGTTVVSLSGDLGSGKTIFAQAVAEILGIKERVTSPTFVIMKNYRLPKGVALSSGKATPWTQLVHIDCYRLDKADDLLHLGWNELVVNPGNLILIEWPERVGDLISSPILKIKFEVVGENSRKIIYGEK